MQLKKQQQQQPSSANVASVNSSAAPRTKSVPTSTGPANSTTTTAAATLTGDHKKTKQSIERKCIPATGTVNVTGDTSGNLGKKNAFNSKDSDKKV